MSFGIYHGGRLRASRIEFLNNHSMRFVLIFDENELGMVRIPFVGLSHVYNVLAAMSVGYQLGISWRAMIERASSLELPQMRLEMIHEQGILILNDTYNANPQSMKAALETLKSLKVKGKKIFVCADMLDLGAQESYWHRLLANDVLASQVNILITVGPLSGLVADEAQRLGFPKANIFQTMGHGEALKNLLEKVLEMDAVLIKGSRAMGMERVVVGLQEELRHRCTVHM